MNRNQRNGRTGTADHDDAKLRRKKKIMGRHLPGNDQSEKNTTVVNDNEIKCMVRSMCNNAYNKVDIYKTIATKEEVEERGDYSHDRSLQNWNQQRIFYDEKMLIASTKDSSIMGKDHHCEAIEINQKNLNRNHEDILESEMLMLKRRIHCNVNQHLKTLETSEEEICMNMKSAKKQILDCIQALQLHHDELLKKEKQYLIDLNQCRQNILLAAHKHYDAEVRSMSEKKTSNRKSDECY